MRFSLSAPRLILLAAALFGLAITASTLAAQSPATSRSVRDGVYTDAQADRGTSIYEGKCLTCHVARMWGGDWAEKSLWDLYDTISNYMPQDNPGSLSGEQARDVLAYILKVNKLPAGMRELPDATEDLKQIRVEPAAP